MGDLISSRAIKVASDEMTLPSLNKMRFLGDA
jgi:hypothetical protein